MESNEPQKAKEHPLFCRATSAGSAVRLLAVAVAAAVVGGLLSLVIPPIGLLLFIAGIVAAILVQKIAGWTYGGDTSNGEQGDE